MRFNILRKLAASAVVCAAAFSAAAAGTYPEKTVFLVIPFAPGGTNDIVGRLVASELSKKYPKSVIADNRAGGGGVVGWGQVAKAQPDGYTLLTSDMSFAIAAGLLPKLSFDPKKDFVPVSTVATVPFVVVVNAEVPAKTIQEFVALAKSKPGQLNYGSAGNGTNSHLAAELFKQKANVNLTHVPYKGAAAAMSDLMGHQIDVLFTALPTALSQIRSGRIRALMVTSNERVAVLPDVPSAKEAGLPEMEMNFWAGVAAPTGTPADVVEKLNADITASLASPSARKVLADQGLTPVGDSPADARAFMNSEIDRWAALVKSANIKPD
ncbi:tripartite tricarboxylate transporter substrate binding protein [Variovorax ureilyticus]|jgi:tripartite-type tricarboxylate transporter receptor subunit TctC|uniref:Tripartite tricarboxylate transporter substrate binding protein n=1 Tax=Variovorax ureilyticus TaxID=1836198 RepID=A0ABU8VPG0_9BURK